MKTLIETTAFVLAFALMALGFLGSLYVLGVSLSGWHGLSLERTWPAVGLLAWGGTCGAAIWRQSKRAIQLYASWSIAAGAALIVMTVTAGSPSWRTTALTSVFLALTTWLVARACSSAKPSGARSGRRSGTPAESQHHQADL